jgi:Fe-S cluster biogenesis protein NfuA
VRELDSLTDTSLRLRIEEHPPKSRIVLDSVPRADSSLLVEDGDRQALQGLFLEHNGDDFTVGVVLEVRPAETPNPDVRLYETSRFLLSGKPFHADSTDAPGLAGLLMALPDVKSLLLRDNLVSVERSEGVRWATLDADVPATVRAWFLACGGMLTAEETGSDDPDWNAVTKVMDETVLPFVHGHGGDIRLIDVKEGVVTVQLFGACATCPASMLTLKGGVQRQLREQLPDIVHTVQAVDA